MNRDPISAAESEVIEESRYRRSPRLLAGLFCLAAVACVTVNIYFPAPEVREAAEKIVDETWGAVAPPAAPAPSNSSLDAAGRVFAWLTFGATPAFAADVDIEVSTASIRRLKEAMKARAAELKPYLAGGSVGVGKSGMLVERDASGLDLAAKAKVRRLVDAENKDREALYAEIASANNFGADRVADIRRIFADTWREKAEGGWWVQSDDGAWKRR